ncbi:hypothetical protein I9W82_002101 [Candida metapsilosis]|uniref:Uncharacterized protein n=1 Tax=Candida metapsilosis TaxID=273372 RepID=A0A8H7ZHR5_9ASCO|nr:hypothetical protein I9W82_002101 [Candida metapsilosis]
MLSKTVFTLLAASSSALAAAVSPSGKVSDKASVPLATATVMSSSTHVITAISTTVVTFNVCDVSSCSSSVVTTGVATISETDTVYTTYCPLPSSSVEPTTSAKPSVSEPMSTETDICTTVITVTSCEENKCSEVPLTTGVTTVSEVDTIYTTYCPLPTTEVPAPAPVNTTVCELCTPAAPVAPVETKPAPVAPVESKPAPVAPVESKPAPVAPIESKPAPVAPVESKPAPVAPIESKPAPVAPVEQAPSAPAPAPVPTVSAYEGAAATNKAMWLSVPLVFVAALL